MPEQTRRQLSLDQRGLSTKRPKPNIVRIELLDGKARDRYLGTIQNVANEVKKAGLNRLVNKNDEKFFGFLKTNSPQSIGMGASWTGSEGDGGVLGAVKKTATSLLGSAATGVVEGVSDIGRSLTGINSKFTGSGSAKRYEGASMKSFSVDCGWYLPEQYMLCVKSLRVLHRMIYPLQLNEPPSAQNLEDIASAAAQSVGLIEGSDSIVNAFVPTETLRTAARKSAEKVVNITNKAIEAFGRNFTFDPIPVKVSIGQFIEVEPIVITGMEISFSKETFVNSDKNKSHIPLTCSVHIDFDYWMNPAPNLEFLRLIGSEMFGQDTSQQEKEQAVIDANTNREVNEGDTGG